MNPKVLGSSPAVFFFYPQDYWCTQYPKAYNREILALHSKTCEGKAHAIYIRFDIMLFILRFIIKLEHNRSEKSSGLVGRATDSEPKGSGFEPG